MVTRFFHIIQNSTFNNILYLTFSTRITIRLLIFNIRVLVISSQEVANFISINNLKIKIVQMII